MKGKIFVRMLAFVLCACLSTFALANSHSFVIGNLINERLSYMKDVAGNKAENHQPIEDLEQEKKVLEKSVTDADSLGLNGETVKPFIQAQMDAAKAIQYRYRADWLSVPEKGWTPRPLDEVRSKISQLSYTILQTLAVRLKHGGPLTKRDEHLFMNEVHQKNLKKSDKQLIWNGLKAVKLK